jgi:hypothetical protein
LTGTKLQYSRWPTPGAPGGSFRPDITHRPRLPLQTRNSEQRRPHRYAVYRAVAADSETLWTRNTCWQSSRVAGPACPPGPQQYAQRFRPRPSNSAASASTAALCGRRRVRLYSIEEAISWPVVASSSSSPCSAWHSSSLRSDSSDSTSSWAASRPFRGSRSSCCASVAIWPRSREPTSSATCAGTRRRPFAGSSTICARRRSTRVSSRSSSNRPASTRRSGARCRKFAMRSWISRSPASRCMPTSNMAATANTISQPPPTRSSCCLRPASI